MSFCINKKHYHEKVMYQKGEICKGGCIGQFKRIAQQSARRHPTITNKQRPGRERMEGRKESTTTRKNNNWNACTFDLNTP
jgi:hypothetical protein